MFENLGLNTDVLILCMMLLIFILVVMVVILSAKTSKLTTIYKKYMRGANGKSLQDNFQEKFKEIDDVIAKNSENDFRLSSLEKSDNSKFNKFAIRKYDAFDGVGGKLSFSLCMLTDDNNGYVLTTVHNAEGSYTYIKEVVNGEVFQKMTAEEKRVIGEALAKHDPVAAVMNRKV